MTHSNKAHQPTVSIIDDDPMLRKSLSWLVRSIGLSADEYPSAVDYLSEDRREQPGCVVTDVRMPHLSGMELLEQLGQHECPPPVIVLTGHGDVPMAVRAMRAGAFDFLEKPFNEQAFLDRVQQAIQADELNRARLSDRYAAREKFACLSSRERQVVELIAAGRANKEIARELRISIKTVETHRTNIFRKLGVEHLTALIRLVHTAGH